MSQAAAPQPRPVSRVLGMSALSKAGRASRCLPESTPMPGLPLPQLLCPKPHSSSGQFGAEGLIGMKRGACPALCILLSLQHRGHSKHLCSGEGRSVLLSSS